MTAKRTDMHRLQELVRLHRLETGDREVARMLKMGPSTERKYRTALARAGLLKGDANEIPSLETLRAAVMEQAPPKLAPQQESSIEHWHAIVEKKLDDGLGATAIYDRLRTEEAEFRGSLSAVKRLVASIQRERGPSQYDVAIPVETDPGDVAQVDFGYAGYRIDPATRKLRKSWVFVMVLGYSRHQYSEVVFDQRTETWLALHERGFRALGGVPHTLVPDNLKAAVIRAAFGTDDVTSELNRSYRELARHYGFKIDPAPPRSPKKKGKVEAGVKYVKNNALKGREGEDLDVTNHYLVTWVREVAGQRIHGTTGKRPLEVFELEERQALMALPVVAYEPVVWKQATVHRDSHVVFSDRMYSVPWRYMEREVWVRATPTSVAVYYDDERIATHCRRGKGLRSTNESHLPAERAALRHRSQKYWEERGDLLGEDVGRFVREVFDSDDVLFRLRQVQAIVTHLERFPAERAQGACRRASFYGSTSYQAIKNILTRALDLEPLPTTRPTAAVWADGPPRFARSTDQWTAAKGASDERH
ncbi:MAG: IS21 family transposase [bacterium]|nr:IS21 family transposase [bacterium]